MRSFVIGLILGIILVPLVGAAVVKSGWLPVATVNAKPWPLESWIARTAIRARLHKEAPKTSPVPFTTDNLKLGAKVYLDNCAGCHGLPNRPAGRWIKGMFPSPPQLFEKDDMVTDDPVGVTYWKVKNGLRLTGMPGFDGALNEQQMWQVSLLLAHADKISPDVTEALKPQ